MYTTLVKETKEIRLEEAFNSQSEALDHASNMIEEELKERYGDIVGTNLLEHVVEIDEEEHDGVEWVDGIYLTQYVVGYEFTSLGFDLSVTCHYFKEEDKQEASRIARHQEEQDYRGMVGF